ncbi:hypothetical protein [Novipirellula caenicola]|uniref:Tetratricopeptide repeat protein n=1 Tax=Novipirellula caenicola TaxID=1536901 RepID=A0ABP9W3Q4_9BACT
MKKTLLSAVLVAAGSFCLLTDSPSANAQNPILSEMYGRGVHSFYAGRYDDANKFLSMAIDNGIKDPRAYYFRGLVATSLGNTYQAEEDWRQGAELEARLGSNASIGRSLARFQGAERLKLEQIRQTARLELMANAASRSQQRYGEIENAAAAATPPATASAPRNAVTPPPIPPEAENPFADDVELATGEPKLESSDAFAGADKGDPAAPAAMDAAATADDANNIFGGGDAGASDPFGGGAPMDDPFAGGGF